MLTKIALTFNTSYCKGGYPECNFVSDRNRTSNEGKGEEQIRGLRIGSIGFWTIDRCFFPALVYFSQTLGFSGVRDECKNVCFVHLTYCLFSYLLVLSRSSTFHPGTMRPGCVRFRFSG